MSYIQRLLNDLCPKGVLHYSLGEVAEYSADRVDSLNLDASSFIGVDNLLANRAGKTDASHRPNTDRVTAYKHGDILVGNIRPYLKKIWFSTNAGGCSGDVLAIRTTHAGREALNPKFLYHILSTDAFFEYNMRHARGAKMPRGDKSAILEYRVPVPPVEVQQEIIRILDSFAELEAGLEAELEARKLQYRHYARALIEGHGDAPLVKLGQVASIVRGASPRPINSFLTTDIDAIPWIKIGDVPAHGKYVTKAHQGVTPAGAAKSRRIFPGDFILSNSMSFGRPYISKIEGCIHDGWLAVSAFGEAFNADYLYYLLRSPAVQDQFERRAGAGTVRNLNAAIVRSIEVPMPPKQRQADVVQALDKFNALVSDLSIGLPAELAARRKQYEYYRDRLLTFKELEA